MSPPRSKQPEDADYVDSTPRRVLKRSKRKIESSAKVQRSSRITKEDKRYTWKSKLYQCVSDVIVRHELKERIDVQRVLLFEIMNHKPHLISSEDVGVKHGGMSWIEADIYGVFKRYYGR